MARRSFPTLDLTLSNVLYSENQRVREVTKAEFKEAYFKYGTEKSGWGGEYWDRFFEPKPPHPMRYMMEPPESAVHARMMIVTDYSEQEYRMFFVREDDEERLFNHP